MAATTLKPISFLVINLFIYHVTTAQTCELSQCEPNIQIQLPFSFKDTDQTQRCGHSRFRIISCNNNNQWQSASFGKIAVSATHNNYNNNTSNQTIVSLRSAGDFAVRNINYQTRTISVNDPQNCLPKRLIGNFTVDLPFRVRYDPQSFTFLNCTGNVSRSRDTLFPVSCLAGESYAIFVARTGGYDDEVLLSCGVVSVVFVPVRERAGYGFGLYEDVEVSWIADSCEDIDCELKGGYCMDDRCILPYPTPLPPSTINPPPANHGDQTPESAVPYAIVIFAVFLIKMALLLRCICGGGLSRATIELYPITRLDGLWQLPDPNQSTCSICLLEYHVGESIRTVLNCRHFFHVQCVDQWFARNSTCPLCRSPTAIPVNSS